VSPLRYALGFYIPEDGILYSHRRGNLKPYKECVTLPTTFVFAGLQLLARAKMPFAFKTIFMTSAYLYWGNNGCMYDVSARFVRSGVRPDWSQCTRVSKR
jgi:hypothetical protein